MIDDELAAVVAAIRRVIDEERFPLASRLAVGLRGELDEAKACVAQSLALKPEINSLVRLRLDEQPRPLGEQTIDVGLRRAGFPEK